MNIMGQYRPEADADEHEELDRRPSLEEYRKVVEHARAIGLGNLDERSLKEAPRQMA